MDHKDMYVDNVYIETQMDTYSIKLSVYLMDKWTGTGKIFARIIDQNCFMMSNVTEFEVYREAVQQMNLYSNQTEQVMAIIYEQLNFSKGKIWKNLGHTDHIHFAPSKEKEFVADLFGGKNYVYKSGNKSVSASMMDISEYLETTFPKKISAAETLPVKEHLPSVADMPGFSQMINCLPGVHEKVKPPVQMDSYFSEPTVKDIIIHLNDNEKWTREQIADWLETLDVDLRFKSPDARLKEQQSKEIKNLEGLLKDYHAAIESNTKQIKTILADNEHLQGNVEKIAQEIQTLKEKLNVQD